MTTRMYFTDALAREFDAEVLSCDASADRFEAVLDRTAFYPTSGGQPFDTGVLGGVRVVDVIDSDEGIIRHVLDAPVTPGDHVSGRIDWPRRFDHMQQHTGQHILSAAFARLFAVRTTSFHLGAETATIDLAREVTPREIGLAEAEANRVVWDDRPVSIRFATEEEAARLPLRKEPARTGLLRLVEVADSPGSPTSAFDLSACGGTHVPQTGMIGVIAIAGWERFKGATRLTFVCGGRALRSHSALRDVVTMATRALSVLPSEVGAAIERLQADLKDRSRTIKRQQEALAADLAARLREAGTTIGPYRSVLTAQPGWDAAALKMLATAIVSEPGMVVVLAGDGPPTPVVVARSPDVDMDVGAWMKRVTAELGGRGGGRPEMAQGGVDAAAEQVLNFARQTLN